MALLLQGLYLQRNSNNKSPTKATQMQISKEYCMLSCSKRVNESRFPHVPTLQIASACPVLSCCPVVSPSPRPTSMCPGCERQHFAALPGRHPKPSATQAMATATRPELLRLLAWLLALLQQIQCHREGKVWLKQKHDKH